jgi:hypothetical protein
MPLCHDAPPGLFTDDVCRVPALTNFQWFAGCVGKKRCEWPDQPTIKHLNQRGLAKGDYYSLLFAYRNHMAPR